MTDDGKGVSILVEETKGKGGEILFHLAKEGVVTGPGKKKAIPSDLKVGQKVSVQTSGGFDDSKPPQAQADRIHIVANPPKQK